MATQLSAVKRAIVGLIGDKQKTIDGDKLYKRVQDQCKRSGVPVPSWPKYIDLIRSANCKPVQRPNGTIIVYLPTRKSL